MCNPAASQGLQIGGAVASAFGGMRTASSQTDAIQRNQQSQMEAVSAQYGENREATINKMAQRSREAMIERARLSVLGIEAGGGGITEFRLQRESQFNLGQDLTLLQSEKDRTDQQIFRGAQGITNNTQSRLSQVKQPDIIGSGLQIAGGYFERETTRKKLEAKARG